MAPVSYSCEQERITHPDGQWTDVSLMRCPADALRFADILEPDPLIRMQDAARLRYFKARIRGEQTPLIIAWACLEQDQRARQLFPTLDTTSPAGEHFVSVNSFVTFTLRELVRRGWLCYQHGEWQAAIPAGYPVWEERATVVLRWLTATGRLWLEAGLGAPLPEATDFAGSDPLLHVTPVGRCGFIRAFVRRQMPAVAFNTSFFLFEHDDFVSDHSALGDPYGLLVVDGVIQRPPLYRRATLWRGSDGAWQIDTIGMADVRLHLPGGAILYPPRSGIGPRFALNPPGETPLALYTRTYGVAEHGAAHGFTPARPGRFELTVIDRRVTGWARGGGLLIPQNGLVLSVAATRDGAPLTAIGDLAPGLAAVRDLLDGGNLAYSFDLPCYQDMTRAQQSGPRLIHKGAITITDEVFTEEEYWPSRADADGWRVGIVPTEFPLNVGATRAARIGIGIDGRGDLIVLAISGSSKGIARECIDSVGATLQELAEHLHSVGAVEAINLDGGGSTQVFVEGGLYNSPGDRRGRRGVSYERMVPTIGLID